MLCWPSFSERSSIVGATATFGFADVSFGVMLFIFLARMHTKQAIMAATRAAPTIPPTIPLTTELSMPALQPEAWRPKYVVQNCSTVMPELQAKHLAVMAAQHILGAGWQLLFAVASCHVP